MFCRRCRKYEHCFLGISTFRTTCSENPGAYLFTLHRSIWDKVIFTIIQRIKMKENIFEAHRHHLYQLLVNKMKWSHLLVSTMYGVIQLLINFSIIYWKLNFVEGILYLIFPTLIMYVLAKFYIFKTTETY